MVGKQYLILVLLITCIGYLQFHFYLGMHMKSFYMQMKFEARRNVREQGVELVCIFEEDVQLRTQTITKTGSGVH